MFQGQLLDSLSFPVLPLPPPLCPPPRAAPAAPALPLGWPWAMVSQLWAVLWGHIPWQQCRALSWLQHLGRMSGMEVLGHRGDMAYPTHKNEHGNCQELQPCWWDEFESLGLSGWSKNFKFEWRNGSLRKNVTFAHPVSPGHSNSQQRAQRAAQHQINPLQLRLADSQSEHSY